MLTEWDSSLGKDPVGQLSCSRVRHQAEANCPFCHQMRYWVLGLVPSPGKTLPGEVDRCLTGPRGMIHVSGEPLDYKKKKESLSNQNASNMQNQERVCSIRCFVCLASLRSLAVKIVSMSDTWIVFLVL